MTVLKEDEKNYLLEYYKYTENELRDEDNLKSYKMEQSILAVESIDECYMLRDMLEDGDYMRRRFLSSLLSLYEDTFEEQYY